MSSPGGEASIKVIGRWLERATRSCKTFRQSALQRSDPIAAHWGLSTGVLTVAERSRRIPCPQCGGAHFVDLEWSPSTGQWSYWCLSSGRVAHDPPANEIVEINADAFARAMAVALDLDASKIKRPVDGVLWELGVAKIPKDAAPWTACVAVGLETPGAMSRLIDALATRVSTVSGLIIAPWTPPEATPLPYKHRFAKLADAFRIENAELVFDARAIGVDRSAKSKTAKGKPGPKPTKAKVLEIARTRAERGVTEPTAKAEAIAIHRAWPRDGTKIPSVANNQKLLGQLKKEGLWSPRPAERRN